MPKLIPVNIGDRFGSLSVSGEMARINGKWRVDCTCDCGGSTNVSTGNLRAGLVASCGCKSSRLTKSTHNKSRTPEYNAWLSMKARCLRGSHPYYPYYGGRGITVCQEWIDSFQVFFEHVGERPSKDHSLDRIDNDMGYVAGNVRWATKSEQQWNRRNVHKLQTKNGERITLLEASQRSGVPVDLLRVRIRKLGLDIDAAMRQEKYLHFHKQD